MIKSENNEINLNYYNQNFWNSQFSKITLKSKIIKLNANFLNYLNSDIFIINEKYETNLKKDESESLSSLDIDEKEKYNEEEKLSETSSKSNSSCITEFPEFDSEILKIIENYENAFIKLNWKAPKVFIKFNYKF